MTSTRTAATATALTATLGPAAAAWVVAVQQMNGMAMGVATERGSFTFFVALWVSMMAAMMLPGATPAVLRLAHANGRVRAVLLFVGSYLAVWALVGVAVYARQDIEHVTVVHIGITAEFASGGPRAGEQLLLKLLREVRRSTRRVKGVRRLELFYGSGRTATPRWRQAAKAAM